MKQLFLFASLLATALNGETMKLVQIQTGRVLIEFNDHQPTFHSRFLERVLREEGILIPPALRSAFNNQEVVFVDDPLFEKAFVEVYWPLYVAPPDSFYEWQQ